MTGHSDEDLGVEALHELVRVGNHDAFGTLFDLHADVIFRFCLLRTEDGEEAQDLVSVVFLEAWRTRSGSFVMAGSLRPWLFGIAGNVVRSHRRSRFRHRRSLRRYHEANELRLLESDATDEVIDRLDAAVAAPQLLGLIAVLPRQQRVVLELCLVEGLTVPEASRALGVPEGTVKSRLSRGRARVQRLGRTGDVRNYVDGADHVGDDRLVPPPSGLRRRQ